MSLCYNTSTMARLNLWDTHAHLDDAQFDNDRDELIAQLGETLAGVINPAVDLKSCEKVIQIAEQYPFIYAAVGWHPENLKGIPADFEDRIARWAQHPKVVAVGEIGLDYYWLENEPPEVQKKILLRQLDLCKQLDLPFIFHDREAHGDTMKIFQTEITGVRGVFHCYSGSLEMAKELAKRGFYFGFGGTSTYKNSQKTREVLQWVPKELMLFETDSPYLSPIPFRGKRNNPAYTEYTARNAAALLNTDFEKLLEQTTKNTLELFKKIPR